MSKHRPRPAADDSLGLDNETETAEKSAPQSASKPRQDQRPVCPKHGGQMVAYATNAMHTYYRCPVETCTARDKKIRPVGPFKDLYGNGASAHD